MTICQGWISLKETDVPHQVLFFISLFAFYTTLVVTGPHLRVCSYPHKFWLCYFTFYLRFARSSRRYNCNSLLLCFDYAFKYVSSADRQGNITAEEVQNIPLCYDPTPYSGIMGYLDRRCTSVSGFYGGEAHKKGINLVDTCEVYSRSVCVYCMCVCACWVSCSRLSPWHSCYNIAALRLISHHLHKSHVRRSDRNARRG